MITWDQLRSATADLADECDEYSGLPFPVEGIPLTIEPRHPRFAEMNGFCFDDPTAKSEEAGTERVINSWYSIPHSAMVYVCDDGPETKRFAVMLPEWGGSRLNYWVKTLGASASWSLDAEVVAMGKLQKSSTCFAGCVLRLPCGPPQKVASIFWLAYACIRSDFSRGPGQGRCVLLMTS